MVDLHEPVIVTDGGPWAEHDMACAVCRRRKAVIDVGSGIFHPCWGCQAEGYVLTRIRSRRRRLHLAQRTVNRPPAEGGDEGGAE